MRKARSVAGSDWWVSHDRAAWPTSAESVVRPRFFQVAQRIKALEVSHGYCVAGPGEVSPHVPNGREPVELFEMGQDEGHNFGRALSECRLGRHGARIIS